MSFSPGQVAEKVLGFDAAFDLPWPYFELLFGYPLPGLLGGTPGITLREVDDFAQHIGKHLPDFRLNFFLQYKRPNFIAGSRGKYRSHWLRPYFEYKILAHQQSALAGLHSVAAGRAAVVYASPAFATNSELFTFAKAKAIIDQSNLVSVERLNNHLRYTYAEKGMLGTAFSEPEDISSPGIDAIFNERFTQEPMKFYDHIIATAQAIKIAMENEEARDTMNLARGAIISASSLSPEELQASRFMDAHITIRAFCDSLGVVFHPVA